MSNQRSEQLLPTLRVDRGTGELQITIVTKTPPDLINRKKGLTAKGERLIQDTLKCSMLIHGFIGWNDKSSITVSIPPDASDEALFYLGAIFAGEKPPARPKVIRTPQSGGHYAN